MIPVVSSNSFSDNSAQNPQDSNNYALRQKFYQLFPYGWDFIVKDTPDARWRTESRFKLTEQKFWYKYSDESQILGLRFDKQTRHGLGDLDTGSTYHPLKNKRYIKVIKKKLREYGINRIVFVQSSDSGGIHFYFFFDRPVNTFRLACVFQKAMVEAKLEVKNGKLETFPNTKEYNNVYNGHRLPLQQGSYLLDENFAPYTIAGLEDFLEAAEWSAAGNDTDLLESKFEEAYKWFKVEKNKQRLYEPTAEDRDFIEQVDYCQREIKEGFINKIRLVVEEGFTDSGETNDLLLTIAKLGRILYGLSGQAFVDYIKETVTGCPGYYKYCNHKHEIDRRCREVARYGEKKWYLYRSRLPKNRPTYQYIKENLSNKPNLNLEKQHNARSRIIQAVEYLEKNSKLPSKVGARKLAIRNFTKEVFGKSVSDATLTKANNLTLWHPKHRKEEAESFTHDTPDSNLLTHTETKTKVKIQVKKDSTSSPKIEPKITAEKPPKKNTTSKENICGAVSRWTKAQDVRKAPPVSQKLPNTKQLKTSEVENATKKIQQPKSEKVIQLLLQLENNETIQHSDCATPCNVVRQNCQNSQSPKDSPSNVHSFLCHTLPLMKGVGLSLCIEFLYLILQRAYFWLLMSTPNLVLSYQGYRGYAASGFVSKKGVKERKVELIRLNSEVEVRREDFHSFCYRDNPKQLLVYIIPADNPENWLNGIFVLVDHLIPLRLKEKTSKNQQQSNNQSKQE